MQRLFFEKQIDLNHALQELISISVNENLAYQDDDEGKRAVGTLEINGDYVCDGKKNRFNDQIEIDVLAPFDRLEEEGSFYLEVQDFDYHIQSGNLSLEIQVIAHGVGKKKERHIVVDGPNEDEQAVLEELQNIISKQELVDCIEEQLKPDDTQENEEVAVLEDKESEEIVEEEIKREDVDDVEIIENAKDSVEAEQIEVLEPVIEKTEDVDKIEERPQENEKQTVLSTVGSDAVEEIEDTNPNETDLPMVQDWQENDSVDVEDLFDDDAMAFVTYPIYIVKQGDTYQGIADRYGMDKETLMDYNHRINLKAHQLLVIPPR